MHTGTLFMVAASISAVTSSACGGFALFPLQDPDTLNAKCPSGTHFGEASFVCCPDGTDLDMSAESYICCPSSNPTCSSSVVPDNLACADSSWVLWTEAFRGPNTACCMADYYPAASRYCLQGTATGPQYSTVAQVGGSACTAGDSAATSSSQPADATSAATSTSDGASADTTPAPTSTSSSGGSASNPSSTSGASAAGPATTTSKSGGSGSAGGDGLAACIMAAAAGFLLDRF